MEGKDLQSPNLQPIVFEFESRAISLKAGGSGQTSSQISLPHQHTPKSLMASQGARKDKAAMHELEEVGPCDRVDGGSRRMLRGSSSRSTGRVTMDAQAPDVVLLDLSRERAAMRNRWLASVFLDAGLQRHGPLPGAQGHVGLAWQAALHAVEEQ